MEQTAARWLAELAARTLGEFDAPAWATAGETSVATEGGAANGEDNGSECALAAFVGHASGAGAQLFLFTQPCGGATSDASLAPAGPAVAAPTSGTPEPSDAAAAAPVTTTTQLHGEPVAPAESMSPGGDAAGAKSDGDVATTASVATAPLPPPPPVDACRRRLCASLSQPTAAQLAPGHSSSGEGTILRVTKLVDGALAPPATTAVPIGDYMASAIEHATLPVSDAAPPPAAAADEGGAPDRKPLTALAQFTGAVDPAPSMSGGDDGDDAGLTSLIVPDVDLGGCGGVGEDDEGDADYTGGGGSPSVPRLLPSSPGGGSGGSPSEAVKAVLVDAVEVWTAVLTAALAGGHPSPAQQQPPHHHDEMGALPLGELAYWRRRSRLLTHLWAQLNTHRVRAIVTALQLGGEPCVDRFAAAYGGLCAAHADARDAARFLGALERNLTVVATGSLRAVARALPPMLGGLHSVWAVSRHYGTDAALLPLLRRLAGELADRVTGAAALPALLVRVRPSAGAVGDGGDGSDDTAGVLTLLDDARAVTAGWRAAYLATRERVEAASGGERRWDFDRRALLERTDYIGTVLGDVGRVVRVAAELGAFLRAPELRALLRVGAGAGSGSGSVGHGAGATSTGAPDGSDATVAATAAAELDALSRVVDGLPLALTALPFSPWERSKVAKWRAEVGALDARVIEIEGRLEALLRAGFARLPSSRAVLELLTRFSPESAASSAGGVGGGATATLPPSSLRLSLRAVLDANAGQVVVKARQELAAAVAHFSAHRADPPREPPDAPPVAGAVAWAHALYLRQKEPILQLQAAAASAAAASSSRGDDDSVRSDIGNGGSTTAVTAGVGGLLSSPPGQALLREYAAFARDVEGYVRNRVAGWRAMVTAALPGLLAQSVLAAARPTAEGSAPDASAAAAQAAASLSIAAALAAAVGDAAAACLPPLPPPPYAVNLPPALATAIDEARRLAAQGRDVPLPAADAVARGDDICGAAAALGALLRRYHAALGGLTVAEATTVGPQLARVQAALRPGFTRQLSWGSLQVGAFVVDVAAAVGELEAALAQLRGADAPAVEVAAPASGDVCSAVAQAVTAAGEQGVTVGAASAGGEVVAVAAGAAASAEAGGT